MDELSGGEPRLCGAKTRSFPFAPCKNGAGKGTDHPGIGACRFHGGSTPNHRAAAAKQRIHDQAVIMLNRGELEPIDNPLLELQKLAAEVLGFKNVLAAQVEQLRGWVYDDLTETEQVRALIMAYERALDRSEKTLSGIVRLNIEDRLARVSEVQAALLISVIEAVIEARELALSKEQRATARTIVAREIPRVTAGAA